MLQNLGGGATTADLDRLAGEPFFGREKDTTIYPIAPANRVLHGIDRPRLWHGNTLTGQVSDDALFRDAPPTFDVVPTNPPFGGREGKEAQPRFACRSGATQVPFLQHAIDNLAPGGRCGIEVDEGMPFETTERAFVRTRRKLLHERDPWAVVSLPGGAFTSAGAGVRTSLLFSTKGRPTESVWYDDFIDVKVGKKSSLTRDRFGDFFRLLPERSASE